MSFTQIQIQATVSAPVQKVWRYWTEPKHITQWNFATPEWCCPSASNDLRVGGKYLARMEAKDGSFGFDFEAIYNEVTPHQNLVYTLLDGRKVATQFESVGETTQITTVFDAETENTLELQKNGWQAILNEFKRYAEQNHID